MGHSMPLPDFSSPAYIYDFVASAMRNGGRFDVDNIMLHRPAACPLFSDWIPGPDSLVTVWCYRHGKPVSMKRWRISETPGVPTVLVGMSVQKG